MLRSMFAAVSGLQAQQTFMDVIGNNIANVNTAGFKSSQVVFEDLLSQSINGAGAPGANSGGIDPAQVGLGARVGGVTTNFAQGSDQETGRSTDVSIQGDGFFVTSLGGQQLYTRAGSFGFDANGNLVTPEGAIVQGWLASGGAIDTSKPLADLKFTPGQVVAPTETGNITMTGNLPSDAATGTVETTSITTYDKTGAATPVDFTFTKTATNVWSVNATTTSGAAAATFTLTFSSGYESTGSPSFTLNPVDGTWNSPITVQFGGASTSADSLSQFAGESTASASAQDGSALGSLLSFAIGNDGSVTGVYSNGQSQTLGQIAIADFNNPSGLEKVGDTSFESTVDSGVPQIGVANSGGRGSLASGTLEMSNVDLAQEFTNMIIAQRGFEANSKVITTSDQILSDLINMTH